MPGTLGIIGWIIIGGLAGWIASKVMKTDAQQGILLNIIVGIVGAFLGGWILSVLGVDTDGAGLIFTFITAIAGACLLIFGLKAITGGRTRG